jgi:transcription elongation factor Elf1
MDLMSQHERLPGEPTCPACGTKADGYTAVGDENATPGTGDCSICAYCRAVAVYVVSDDGSVALRDATTEELMEIRRHPEVRAAQEAVAEMHRQYGAPRP